MFTWSLDKKSAVRIQSRKNCWFFFFNSVLSSSINTELKQCGSKHRILSLTYRLSMMFISAAELKKSQQ